MRYWGVVGISKNSAAASASKGAILNATADAAPAVRIAALRAAAVHLGDDDAIHKLAEELKNSNQYIRLHALHALDAVGKRAAAVRSQVTPLVNDETEYVKRVAEHIVATLSGA